MLYSSAGFPRHDIQLLFYKLLNFSTSRLLMFFVRISFKFRTNRCLRSTTVLFLSLAVLTLPAVAHRTNFGGSGS